MLERLRADFIHPQEEFSPIPFWFWNDNLTEVEIRRQIHDFHEKGVNGFVIHPRIGIPKEIEYLSDRFMELVLCAVVEAKLLGMKVVLYDEAMYPSGSAHGMVVKKNPEYASKALKMVEYQCYGKIQIKLEETELGKVVSVQAVKKVSDKVILPESIRIVEITEDEIDFEADFTGDWSILIFSQTYTNGHIRGIHFGEDDGEMDAPASSDLLSKEAMEEFLHLTHDRYYEVLQQYFGTTIIGMFTDEPGIMGRGDHAGLKPWTDDFLAYYIEHGNSELDLPYLWFDAGETTDRKRRSYEETVNRRMEETYYQPIFEWCEQHKIAFTGHPEKSDDIGFLKFFHMPAQDLVYRWVAPEGELGIVGQHSTMAKCTSDSARHRGKRRNGNECFACCGKNKVEWAFSADDMKWYMDWLFVRGVNLLIPHAFFYSIDGPRRIGERPPDVGPNNIWWPYYNQISDYIKRMSYLMTDSVNQAQVAVLCNGHELPYRIVKSLYENQIEFNYLEKELFQGEECRIEASSITIAKQLYKVLIIEDIQLIDMNILPKLQTLIKQGGNVIIYNPLNKKVELKQAVVIKSFHYLANMIQECICPDVIPSEVVKDLRMSHIMKDGYDFFVFVNEGENEIKTTIKLRAKGNMELWDAWRGTCTTVNSVKDIDATYQQLDLMIQRRESLIYVIDSNTKSYLDKDIEKATENLTEYHETNNIPNLVEIIPLDNNWYMGQDIHTRNIVTELNPWNEVAGLEHYSGTMVYQTSFNVRQSKDYQKVELNLGDVYEIAKVTLNGCVVGVCMWSPYVFDLTDLIIEGNNDLVVEVTNTLANSICNLNLASGLVGPVAIHVTRKIIV
jgi:hypothetical protein